MTDKAKQFQERIDITITDRDLSITETWKVGAHRDNLFIGYEDDDDSTEKSSLGFDLELAKRIHEALGLAIMWKEQQEKFI